MDNIIVDCFFFTHSVHITAMPPNNNNNNRSTSTVPQGPKMQKCWQHHGRIKVDSEQTGL